MKTACWIPLVVFLANCCSATKYPWQLKLAGLNLTQNSRESKEAAVKTQDQPSDVITERGSESSAQKTVQNHQKRVLPAAVAEVGTEIIKDLAKEAVQKQLKIIEEQQKKAEEFVNKKLKLNIEPNKGWKTETMFVPAGVHIDAEYTNSGKAEKKNSGIQPFAYPMGVGGVMMNGCYGRDYQKGDPCYAAKRMSAKCLDLIDGAAFIGVGFDGRSDYSPESRKMSIIQRVCAGKASYDGDDVPDTMNVHGVYDTSTSMHSFYSRQEYQTYLQQQAGIAGTAFGFYDGVKEAWGRSSLSGSEKYMSLLSIDIDRYEIYLDEVKPGDLSVNFLEEFMDLPTSYLAPGASVKFQNFILRWGTHYIKSGKFGGRLQIFKTMDANQVSSKEEFSQVMEAGYKSLFASIHAKHEQSGGNSAKAQAKTSSTSISVEGGDQQIAAIITDFNSPTIKYDLTQWLGSIRTYPKPFTFMVAPIIDLLKFNPSSLFPGEKRDWGCEAHITEMKEDPETKQHYYGIKLNGTIARQFCPYKDRDHLIILIERRRNGLERAVGVYMEEGPISTSDITLPAGLPGCQTKNYRFQVEARKPSWDEITKYETHFLVIFNTRKRLSGTFDGPVAIYPHTDKFARFYNGEWFIGDSRDHMDLTTGCKRSKGKDNKICVLGLVLTYNAQNGFLTLAKEDFNVSKEAFPSLTTDLIGSLIAHVEWPPDYIFQLKEVVGYLPCNVKWSNVLRFDPSNKGGKCLHFSASSKGTIFVIFAAVPDNKDTWYYVQISPYGVGIFKSQRLMVSTIDVNAVGLGADILYQSYFVCLKETSESTVIEYGKTQGTTENGDVYLTMIDRDDPLFVRFYSFGNGEEPLEVVDAHIITRHLTKANCKGGTGLDNQTNMCVQHCHILCDPTQGCRGSSREKPLATNCNACRFVMNAVTGECLKECPKGWEKLKDNTCRNIAPCDGVQCLNGGTCRNLEHGKFKCECLKGIAGQYCEGNACDLKPCLNGATCKNFAEGRYSCLCKNGWKGRRCNESNACSSSPCVNGATCSERSGNYSCQCKSGWKGQNCAVVNANGLEVSVIVGQNYDQARNLTNFLKPVARSGYHWKLCWRASRDGWAAERFHSLCDDKGPTVTIIKVGKYIFGGYASESWISGCDFGYDSKAFLFSLVNKPGWAPVKLTQTGPQSYSTYSCSSYGPTFGRGHDIKVSDYASSNTNSYTNLGESYGPPSGYSAGSTFVKTFLAGSFNFHPDEVETFYETT